MTKIMFRTVGLIDIRAFTTMGMSAKPATTSPIGYFGTGLKYAVAVTLRLGGSVTVFIGRDRYEFFLQSTDFRGKEFQLVRMRRKRWSLTRSTTHDLPFTTQYGRNWKWWQVFRELESNTRDEHGGTYTVPDDQEISGEEGHTTIVVTGDGIVNAYEHRDEVFLPDSAREGTGVQMIGRSSKYAYWRGLRVYELQCPTMRTYNMLNYVSLTEDRTLYGDFQLRDELANHVLQSTDADYIESVLTCDDAWYEHTMEFPKDVAPGPVFREVALRCRPTIPMFGTYWSNWSSRSGAATYKNPWLVHPIPWCASCDAVTDANGALVFERPRNYANGDWQRIAEAMCKRVGRPRDER